MKTEITIPNETPRKLTFPLLAREKRTGNIFRFSDSEHGVRMLNSDGTAATNSERWFPRAPVTDLNRWEILPPGATLTQIQE